MNKAEYIAAYGEEAYKKKKAASRAWTLNKVYGIKPPVKTVDYYKTKIHGPLPITGLENASRSVHSEARMAMMTKIAASIQYELRRKWKRDRQSIIIVEAGNVLKDKATYHIELYELGLTKEEIAAFEEICAKIEPKDL